MKCHCHSPIMKQNSPCTLVLILSAWPKSLYSITCTGYNVIIVRNLETKPIMYILGVWRIPWWVYVYELSHHEHTQCNDQHSTEIPNDEGDLLSCIFVQGSRHYNSSCLVVDCKGFCVVVITISECIIVENVASVITGCEIPNTVGKKKIQSAYCSFCNLVPIIDWKNVSIYLPIGRS